MTKITLRELVREIFKNEFHPIKKEVFHEINGGLRPDDVAEELDEMWEEVKKKYKEKRNRREPHISYMELGSFYVFVGVKVYALVPLKKSLRCSLRLAKTASKSFPFSNTSEEELLAMNKEELCDLLTEMPAKQVSELLAYFSIPHKQRMSYDNLRELAVREIHQIGVYSRISK